MGARLILLRSDMLMGPRGELFVSSPVNCPSRPSRLCTFSPLLLVPSHLCFLGVFPWAKGEGGGFTGFPHGNFTMSLKVLLHYLISPYCEREEKYSIFPLSGGQGQSPINPSLTQFVFRVHSFVFTFVCITVFTPFL